MDVDRGLGRDCKAGIASSFPSSKETAPEKNIQNINICTFESFRGLRVSLIARLRQNDQFATQQDLQARGDDRPRPSAKR